MRRFSILAVMAALSLCACTTAHDRSHGGYPGSGAGGTDGGTVYPQPEMVDPGAAIGAAATIADLTGVAPPVVYADATTLDEVGVIGFGNAVAAAADLATLAVRLDQVPDAILPQLQARSADARVAVQAVRDAYATGNAASYRVAARRAECVILGVRALSTNRQDTVCPGDTQGDSR